MVYSEEREYDSLEDLASEWEMDWVLKYEARIQKVGGELFNSFFGSNLPWTGIHVDTWDKYYKPRKKADLMVLLTHLALKSIIQRSSWKNVKNEFLFARMAGYESSKGDTEIPESIREFMKTGSRTRTKLFQELEALNFKRVASSRGITYSFSLSLSELEFVVKKARFLSSEQKLKESKAKAKKEAEERFQQWKKNRETGEVEN